MLPYNRNLKQLSRQLRESMTEAERHLWAKIRMKQLKGCQFYRQKPIGDYVVDFFCPKAKLAIEVDGSHHLVGEKIEYDRIRDEYLSSLGLRVLRFTNTEVLTHIEGVVESIEEEILRKIPLSPPLLKGETKRGKTPENNGESERGEAPLHQTSPSPLKERGTKGVR